MAASAVFSIWRSALVVTVVLADFRLLLLLGSGTPLPTSALFTRIVPDGTSGLTFTTTANVTAGAPLAIAPRLHLSGFDGSPGTTPAWHDPWLGVALTKLTSPGRV